MDLRGLDLHLDCASGIAGDMFLGACLDLGMPLEVITDAVAALGLQGVSVETRRALRGGFAGTRFRVLVGGRPVEGPDPDEAAARPGEAAASDAPVNGHPHHHDQHHHDHHDHEPHRDHEHHHDHGHHDHGHHHHTPAPGSPHGQRDLAQIRSLIAASRLAPAVRDRATRLFARLGEAEAKAHGVPVDRVHFHEVGAVDSIVDLVGAAAAIEYLAPRRVTCSAVNLGSGRVRTAHGDLAVPAPATAALLRGMPVYSGPGGELTTPTGAVLLAELVDAFGDLPPLLLAGAGLGLGKKIVPAQANLLRILSGTPAAASADASGASSATAAAAGAGDIRSPGPLPQVAVVECEVDDLTGEGFGFVMERLLAAGALDVYFTPVVMKKSRPGTLVTMLCRPDALRELTAVLLVESGSLGCRYHLAARAEMRRDTVEVATEYGTVRIKRGQWDSGPLIQAPEYEDCRRLALQAGVPWRQVHQAALAALPGTTALPPTPATTAATADASLPT